MVNYGYIIAEKYSFVKELFKIQPMKKYLFALLFLLMSTVNLQAQQIDVIKPAGEKLLKDYLSMNVENLWIAGHHVDWVTGLPDNPEAKAGTRTHCSAFVASACKKEDIYILSPPEHSQILLANAQYKWLSSTAATSMGWHIITDTNTSKIYFSAQQYANKGFVVVAVYQNPVSNKPGHIALVRPNEMSVQQLIDEGPSIIMAGTNNHNLIGLKNGFKSHIQQWPEPAILFYYNENKK